MRVDAFVAFIRQRDAHRLVKEGTPPKGFVADPIISEYRFCNVRREDDRVTKWIAANWRSGHDGYGKVDDYDPDLWFAMVVARLFNLPATLAALGYPVPFKPEKLRAILHKRKAAGHKLFNGAYIVSTNGKSMDKVDYLFQHVLQPLWAARRALRYDYQTLESWHEQMCEYDGLGSFMAGQVIADVKYSERVIMASDWRTFAASGPGSRRGLNRVMLNPVDKGWREYEWKDALDILRRATLPKLPRPIHALHAQDIQNCLCEFDKYERVRLGEGTPKQFYKPFIEEK